MMGEEERKGWTRIVGWDPAVIESELPRTSGAGLAPPHRPERQKDAV